MRTKRSKRGRLGEGKRRIYESKLWPQIRKAAIANVAAGQYMDEACRAAGISNQVFYKYQRLAEVVIEQAMSKAVAEGHDDFLRYVPEEDREYVEFVLEMQAAQAQARTLAAGEFRKKDPGEYLARVDHERWGRKDRMILSGDKNAPVVTELRIKLVE